MNTKKSNRFVRGLLIACLALVSCHGAVAAQKVVIKFGTIAPEGSAWHDALLELRQQWLQMSGNRIELRIYAGGVLGGETEMVRKVQRRGLDGVAISGSALPRIDGSVGCLNVPLLFESYEQLDYVRERISQDVEQRFEERGFKILAWAEGGWVYFFSRSPVRTPDDLRKLRLWTTPGFPEFERLFKKLGLKVVPLPATDMLTSLQTGLIEVIDVPPLFALLDRSYQVANHMTDLKWAPLNAAVVLSAKTWNKVPQDLHEDFLYAASEIVGRLRVNVHKAEREALEEMKDRGLNIVSLSESDVEEWHTEVESAILDIPCRRDYPDIFEKVMQIRKEGQ